MVNQDGELGILDCNTYVHLFSKHGEFKRTIKSLDKFIKRAEIVAYKSDYGKNVHYSIKKPDLFLVCCVLEIKNHTEQDTIENASDDTEDENDSGQITLEL